MRSYGAYRLAILVVYFILLVTNCIITIKVLSTVKLSNLILYRVILHNYNKVIIYYYKNIKIKIISYMDILHFTILKITPITNYYFFFKSKLLKVIIKNIFYSILRILPVSTHPQISAIRFVNFAPFVVQRRF